ncbi:RT0821/Lpp0805 family surface protein [Amorphus sp. 3PC139-8]|uniref:RT0821/Lpp0805 family surface protein n=1 Tax=Amorphus sp. 3PC139-8 TaxID=2735676 RepID=UPI00345CF3C5
MSIGDRARYNALRLLRHRAPFVVLVCALSLGGCAMFGSGGKLFASSSETASNAPLSDPLLEGSGLSGNDLIAIGNALGTDVASPAESRLWENPAEGTGGRLIDVTDIPAPDYGLCRSFVTTVNAPTGLFLMSGIGCRRPDGNWVVDGIAPAETTEAA